LPLPDQSELASAFFARVRANCAAASKGRTRERLSARPFDVFLIWDYLSAALTYCFQREIAVKNGYLTRINWFEDRVSTYLECRLAGWIESKGRTAEIDMAAAVRASIDLVPVDMIWEFAVKEIARQLDKEPSELLLPNWEAAAKALFTNVHKVCTAGLKSDQNPPNEPNKNY